jgi:hypothetical protein
MSSKGWFGQQGAGGADGGGKRPVGPSRALRGEIPLALLGTDAGAELVADELGRIEFGDLY